LIDILSTLENCFDSVIKHKAKDTLEDEIENMASSSFEIEASELQILQEEVSCLNGIGIDFYHKGKLKSATAHFHHALDRLKVICKTKKKMLHPSSSSSSMTLHTSGISSNRKAGDPLPIDMGSSVLSPRWETIASMALMHNASLVHYRSDKFSQSKGLLELARGVLRKEGLFQDGILERNMYATAVVSAVYSEYGRVLLKLKESKKAHKAFLTATALMKRYNIAIKARWAERSASEALVSIPHSLTGVLDVNQSLEDVHKVTPLPSKRDLMATVKDSVYGYPGSLEQMENTLFYAHERDCLSPATLQAHSFFKHSDPPSLPF